MNKETLKAFFTSKFAKRCYLCLLIALLFGAVFIMGRRSMEKESDEPYVVSETALEKIVKISTLSTFEAVYNGIAQVYNEKDPLQIDYYVSYEAVAKVGFDTNDINISIDHEKKKIVVDLPALELTEINVEPDSLEFIFYNDKRNSFGISKEALDECKSDARRACTYEESLYQLASENAKRIVKALIEPFLSSLDCEYTLTVNQEATRR